MRFSGEDERKRILHILTLSTINGEFGGPAKVARETCIELNKIGYSTEIFSGTKRDLQPEEIPNLNQTFTIAVPILRKLPVSSLWSKDMFRELRTKILKYDLIHIHLARDIIPIVAALLCLIYKKKFVVQTHGMVVPDSRVSTWIIDQLFIIPILKSSSRNYVLTNNELIRISKISRKVNFEILGNGISIPKIKLPKRHGNISEIVFCSRLHSQKGLEKFLALADSQKGNKFRFTIYGPDGGQLPMLERYLRNASRNLMVSYRGALNPSEVVNIISKYDLLILPSHKENFPMVVLEAMSVGVPVLVMKSCGISETIRKFNDAFVCRDESTTGLIEAFNRLVNGHSAKEREVLINFCEQNFSIANVALSLSTNYNQIIGCDQN